MYTLGSSGLVYVYKLKYTVVFKNLNKLKQILISLYLFIHLQDTIINGWTKKKHKVMLNFHISEICISG